MNNHTNALQIGDTYPKVGCTYCADDNTYTPYTYDAIAWACPMRSRLPQPPEPEDLYAALFG